VAVAALTKNLADELGPKGVNVTVVHPGLTRTERTAAIVAAAVASSGNTPAEVEGRLSSATTIGRIVDADEVADVVAFLASPRSVAINGDAIACGGGAKGAIHCLVKWKVEGGLDAAFGLSATGELKRLCVRILTIAHLKIGCGLHRRSRVIRRRASRLERR
jgi:NAD(P)-dependent dehydrogenase (short-subunit alcohol dehydrogenase family)